MSFLMNSPSSANDSFLTKLETFRKKKKSKKEVEELAREGRKAMESALCSLAVEDPENYMLEEGQERSIIEKTSLESAPVKELIGALISWINDELVDHRILVRNVADDFYDGQILQNLAEKLAGIRLDYPEVTQSEFGQMQKLKDVVVTINQLLGVSEEWASERWTAELIHNKDVIAIVRLLVALARHFKAGIRLADGVHLVVIIVRKMNGKLEYRYQQEYLTDPSPSTVVNIFHWLMNAHRSPTELARPALPWVSLVFVGNTICLNSFSFDPVVEHSAASVGFELQKAREGCRGFEFH
ncbi:unnamed protein product [Dibothriocephalus latus]|uniref:Calponin-homology (CH) domain-containing protein n=1 Tax=Dibothriocephalus latus TaxID=60516 RepID=A0A3P7NG23_DIBLA|nr:unnamed protein product [Dibothriocephalus latus]